MTALNLYRFHLPTRANTGESYHNAMLAWRDWTINLVGGITIGALVRGVWIDDTGKEYEETIQLFDVACTSEQHATLLQFAFNLFPDQVCIFHAELGKANISYRP